MDVLERMRAMEQRGTRFTSKNNTKLYITATGLQSLKSSNIYCPYPYGECTINVEPTASDTLTNADIFSVDGPDAFDLFCNYSLASAHCYTESNPPKFLCQSDYKATCSMSLGEFECADMMDSNISICSSNTTAHHGIYFVCNDAYECQSDTISCTEDHDCDVICSGSSSCISAEIISSSQDSDVLCSGSRSCQSAHIICSDGMDCKVDCTGGYACYAATIDGPTNGNLTVSCTSIHSCLSARINCPTNGVCYVDATAASSTTPSNSLVINAADMMSGSFTVYSARSGTIKCPAGGVECNVLCGQYGCLGTTFTSQNNTKLHITATGLQSLKSSNIYCPYPYGECAINVEPTASDALTDADIFSINGPDAFDLLCNYSLSSGHCYTESNPPKFLCQSDYKATCAMSLGEFECAEVDIDSNDTISICSSNITAAHHGTYFLCNEASECKSNTISCTEGQDCDVICSGDYSCQSNQIICSGDCGVTCSASYGCKSAQIITTSQALSNVICSGGRSCEYSRITCGDGSDCNVDCTGENACNGATIDGPTNGNLTVSCTRKNSCVSANSFVIDAADMISGSFLVHSARSGTVKCPAGDVECNVICGKYGCLGTRFTSKNNTKLYITATGLQSLKSSNIYCPYPYGECTIDIES
eukprot:198612_1